jgi:hypothetical protein
MKFFWLESSQRKSAGRAADFQCSANVVEIIAACKHLGAKTKSSFTGTSCIKHKMCHMTVNGWTSWQETFMMGIQAWDENPGCHTPGLHGLGASAADMARHLAKPTTPSHHSRIHVLIDL